MSPRPRSGPRLRLAAALLLGLPPGAALSAGVEVDTLRLEMRPQDADTLFQGNPYDPAGLPVTVIEGAERLAGRIEVKGSSTRELKKRSLLVKLEGGARWRGQSRIALNAMATDPSVMREHLAWGLVHALGMAAPEVRYTRLEINGGSSGLYLRIEWVGKAVFERAGLGGGGELYHPRDETFCGNLSPQTLKDPGRCWAKLLPGDGDFSSLRALGKEAAGTTPKAFEGFVDKAFDGDSLLKWIAVNVLTSSGDAYNKNYFLYRSDRTGRWTVVPWDYDLTFGRNWDPHLPFPQSVLNDNFQYFYGLELGMPGPLKDKTLANPALRKRLLALVAELLEGKPTPQKPWAGWFSPEAMSRRIDEAVRAMREAASGDPFIAAGRPGLDAQAAALKHYCLARYAYLQRLVLSNVEWGRDRSVRSLRPGETALFADGWGFLLGTLKARQAAGPVEVGLEVVRGGPPDHLPPGAAPESCARRTWLLAVRTPGRSLKADLLLEYLEENSRSTEVGPSDADEEGLALFLNADGAWRRLEASHNPVANTFSVAGLELPPARLLRFVACR